MKKGRILISILIIMIMISGCSSSLTGEKQDYVVFSCEELTGVFNSIYAENQSDVFVNELLFASLLEIDENGKVISSVADYKISEDQKTYEFSLKNVKFSNGELLTSSDVEFTLKVLCDSSYYGIYDFSKSGILGFSQYFEGDAENIKGFKILDDKQFSIELESPNAGFINLLTFGILSKNYYGNQFSKGDTGTIEALHNSPLGAGQYTLSEYVDGESAVLLANENYFKGSPKIKKVIFKSTTVGEEVEKIIAGESQLALVPATDDYLDRATKAGNINTIEYLANDMGTIGFNCADEILSDVNVRQAIAYATNRKDVINRVFQSHAKVINIPTTELSFSYTEDVNTYEYNLDKANEILIHAGYVKNRNGLFEKDGKALKINILAETPNEVTDVLLPVMKDDLLKVGIELNIQNIDFNTMLDKVFNKEAQSWFLTWGLTVEPSEMSGMFETDGSYNIYGYSNSKIDELYGLGLTNLDMETRKPYYVEINQILNEELPCLPLYQRNSLWLIDKKIKGISATAYRSPFIDFYQVKLGND